MFQTSRTTTALAVVLVVVFNLYIYRHVIERLFR
jgi:hypothetical protein